MAALALHTFAQLPEAYQQISWQLAVSFGEAFAPESACFDALEALVSGSPDHYVGFLTYDLKNELEALHSTHPDGIGFAPMLLQSKLCALYRVP